MDSNLWIFVGKKKKKKEAAENQSLQFPMHLLYVTMAIQMQCSLLFIRAEDVTQQSPVS